MATGRPQQKEVGSRRGTMVPKETIWHDAFQNRFSRERSQIRETRSSILSGEIHSMLLLYNAKASVRFSIGEGLRREFERFRSNLESGFDPVSHAQGGPLSDRHLSDLRAVRLRSRV